MKQVVANLVDSLKDLLGSKARTFVRPFQTVRNRLSAEYVNHRQLNLEIEQLRIACLERVEELREFVGLHQESPLCFVATTPARILV